MKKFTLIIGILVVGSMVFAQRLAEPQHRLSKMTDASQNNEQETTTRTNKAHGDIIFEEYFNSSDWSAASVDGVAVPENMPAGWSVFDYTGNNFFWRWSTKGPRGVYTSYNDGSPQWWTVPRESSKIRSTSDTHYTEKGFLMFELAFYNTTSDGDWSSNPIQHDSYIQLPPIETTENSAVNVHFEQFHRFCCTNYSAEVGPKLYVSNDNINWTRYDIDQAPINATPPNPCVYEMSISSVAANQSTVYIRLQTKGDIAYFWMVDDFILYEPYPYDVRVIDYWIDYKEGKWGNYFKDGYFMPSYKKRFTGTPYYNPYYAFQKIVTSRAIAKNYGAETFPEAMITTKIVKKDGTVLDEKTSAVVSNFAPGELDTSFVAIHNFQIPKTIESAGSYYYEGVVSGAVEDEIPENNLYRYDFHITENVFGYANPLTANTDRQSPFSYTTAVDGDGLAVEFFLNPPTDSIPGTETPAPYVLRGINTYISNNGYNWDIWESGNMAYLTAEIYESDTAGNYDLTAPIISSASTPINSTMADSWVFLPFIADETSEYITPTVEGQAYLAVIRFNTYGERFFIGADKITQPSIYSNLFIAGDSIAWTGMEANISMELIVDKYGESPTGSAKVTALIDLICTKEIIPLRNSPVEIRIPNINENGELTGIDIVTQTTDNNGVVTFDNLRSGSYTVVTTAMNEYGVIYTDEDGNPIRKSAGVTVQGSDTYEVTIIIDNRIGINEPNLLRNVKLYPVPSNNTVTIESPVNISRIVISNIVGQVVQTIKNPTQVQTISVANYVTGVYLITLFDNNGNSITQRLIKH